MRESVRNHTPRLAFVIALIAIATSTLSAQSMFRKVNDFDGDSKADFVVTRAENFLMVWHIWRSTAGYLPVQWGVPSDRVAAGDYNGDGRTDIAVARETPGDSSSFSTYILHSQVNSIEIKTVTNPFSFALFSGPQDYDGDGRTDPTVSRSANGTTSIFFLSSSSGVTGAASLPTALIARIGDVTGDGRSEAVSYLVPAGTPNEKLWIRNLATGELRSQLWGVPGDEPLRHRRRTGTCGL